MATDRWLAALHDLAKERITFALYSPIMTPVWHLTQSRLCDYAVCCKECAEIIPAPVATLPDSWIVAECPLCGVQRGYLPADIFRGKLSHKLVAKATRVRP